MERTLKEPQTMEGASLRGRNEALRQARSKLDQGSPEEAGELFHVAMADDPSDPEVYRGLSQAASQSGCSILADLYLLLAAELGPQVGGVEKKAGNNPDSSAAGKDL